MPDTAIPQGAAYRPDQIILQLDPNATAAEHSRALEAIGGRLLDIIRGGEAGEGELARIGLGQGVTVEKAIQILSHLPGVKFAEPDFVLTGQSVSNDTSVASGQTWGLYGDVGTPTNVYGSQASEAWAAGNIGSTKTAIGVVDTGIDYTHPDLYLNIWLNQKEIPLAFRSSLTDADADGVITFRDLNDSRNSSYVADKNGNGRIDAGDLLNDARWENGLDDDANGYRDDLIGWDFVNNDNDPMDDHSHGTHIAGTIGATGGNGEGVAGVAWNVQMVALKFLDASNYGYTSNSIKALDYFTNASKQGTGVEFVATNNSWGGTAYSTGLVDAVVRGAKADILYVVSAGNNGSNNDATPYYPSSISTVAGAGYEAVISVAALTSAGGLASWSNYGSTSVDIAAPGSGIYSTMPGGGYGSKSGTSMAAPHVTGALALYAAAHVGFSAQQLREALLASATPTASVLDKVASDGRLDVAQFLDTLAAVEPPPPEPTPTPPPPTTGVVITGTSGADAIAPSTSTTGLTTVLPTSYGDTISGLEGNDTLNGGSGADNLLGGAGNDVYVVDNAGDTIVELAGEGDDLVQSSVSHTLDANVERLTLTGSANVSGTGNDLSNILTGNSGANFMFGALGDDKLDGLGGNDNLDGGLGRDTVLGGAGNDTLDGGAGADLYTGGSGKDTFVLARGEAAGDVISDFAKGDKLLLTGYSAGSTLAKSGGAWVITDAATGQTELIQLSNGYSLKTSDFLFG
ncbi:S8 family serine peptidase [Phenylobacterium sp.]|uniref:S8 family serine peptidase n=1 Tax=Phenylobacterium sp. TaxID=1871053 RepID=UPI002ED78E59